MDGDDLCIRDTGMGIAPEDLPRIFDQGVHGLNGRRDTRASGIGLYLCRRICRSLGHTIRASSVPNQGTEIRIGLGPEENVAGVKSDNCEQKTRHPGRGVVFFHLSIFPYTKQLKIYTKLTLKNCPLLPSCKMKTRGI